MQWLFAVHLWKQLRDCASDQYRNGIEIATECRKSETLRLDQRGTSTAKGVHHSRFVTRELSHNDLLSFFQSVVGRKLRPICYEAFNDV